MRVTLDDAPHPDSGRTLPGDPNPDLLVVHQQDVQAVVNALWAGGARAMQIMDQRVIATSAVRCVGNTLLLHGVVYSPPYVITAVGDPTALRHALDASPDVQIYKQYVSAYQQRVALQLGALAADPQHAPAGCAPSLLVCRYDVAHRIEVLRFLQARRLNLFSPAFRTRNRLYADPAQLPH